MCYMTYYTRYTHKPVILEISLQVGTLFNINILPLIIVMCHMNAPTEISILHPQ